MTENAFFERNLELSTEFSKYLLSHPEIERQIPEGAQVVFQLETDAELNRWNLEMAKKQKDQGQAVVMVRIKGLRPEMSRLIEPRLDNATGF